MGSSHKLHASPFALIHKRCFVEMFFHLHHQRYWLQNIHFFFLLLRLYGMAIYGFHCTLSSALPICMAEWISRTHLIFQSKQTKKKNTLEVQKNWTRSASEQESSEQLFFFFFLRVNCAENSLNCRTALSISKREGEFAATLQKLAVFVRRAV